MGFSLSGRFFSKNAAIYCWKRKRHVELSRAFSASELLYRLFRGFLAKSCTVLIHFKQDSCLSNLSACSLQTSKRRFGKKRAAKVTLFQRFEPLVAANFRKKLWEHVFEKPRCQPEPDPSTERTRTRGSCRKNQNQRLLQKEPEKGLAASEQHALTR